MGKQLVEQDQVFAVVPVVSITLAAGAYFAQQHVPFFRWGISPQFLGNKYGFSFAGAVTSPSWEITVHGAEIAKVFGKSPKDLTMAIIGEDSTASNSRPLRWSPHEVDRLQDRLRREPVAATPAVVSSYTPYVQQDLDHRRRPATECPDGSDLAREPPFAAGDERAGYKGAMDQLHPVLAGPGASAGCLCIPAVRPVPSRLDQPGDGHLIKRVEESTRMRR